VFEGGVGGVGAGGGGAFPHHFALPPELHEPKQVSSVMHPGAVVDIK